MYLVPLLMLATASSATSAKPIYGIARAADGDSLELNGETRVRLYGIDAPEIDQSCTRDGKQWDCGTQATQQLARLVTGREVRCMPNGTDQFGRMLARCSVGAVDVNAAMVEAGYAVAFRKYSTEYVAAETRAKAAKRGLWAGTFAIPSEVRASARSQVAKARPQASRSAAPQRFSGGCVIKGNRSRRGDWIYHLPGMPYYEQTRPEEIFCSERDAQAAGYRRAIVR